MMLKTRFTRYAIYQTTAEITNGSQPVAGVSWNATILRQPSEAAWLKFTVSGPSLAAGDRIQIGGNQVNVLSAGVYFFPDKITTLDAVMNFINCSANVTALITEQCNDAREPLMQRVFTGYYLMGGKLVQKRSQLDRETVGEIDYADQFSYTIPARWSDTVIEEKDFIEDADGVFYLVTSKRKMPSGVIVLSLTRIKA